MTAPLTLYGINGLPFWDERAILTRERIAAELVRGVRHLLAWTNRAWSMVRCEAPILTPVSLLSAAYTEDDVWFQRVEPRRLALRPETTPGSYAYAAHLLDAKALRPPVCVYQIGKSFRREQEHPSSHVRLREFYQAEFQCIYARDTKNDYHSAVLAPVAALVARIVSLPTRIVRSDRLPAYSEITTDIEVEHAGRWMEVCSISRRMDFPTPVRVPTSSGVVERPVYVLEIAFGLDRLAVATCAREDAAERTLVTGGDAP